MSAPVRSRISSGVAGRSDSGFSRRAVARKPASALTLQGRCSNAQRAVRYYSRRLNEWRAKMDQSALPSEKPRTCARARYLADRLRVKARAARLAFARWRHHEYAWWDWMSDKFQRIGACETGYGKKPGNFHWNSGTYQGFAGFYFGTWDAYKPKGAPSEAYLATPREQYECALNVLARHGYGAWGCGGA